MQKCSLCGGKVVNGRCEECGMPIPPEDRYVLRSDKEKVHVHDVNGEKVLHRVRSATGKKPFYLCTEKSERPGPQRAARPAPPRWTPRGDEKKKRGSWIWAFVVIAALLAMLPDLLDAFR